MEALSASVQMVMWFMSLRWLMRYTALAGFHLVNRPSVSEVMFGILIPGMQQEQAHPWEVLHKACPFGVHSSDGGSAHTPASLSTVQFPLTACFPVLSYSVGQVSEFRP